MILLCTAHRPDCWPAPREVGWQEPPGLPWRSQGARARWLCSGEAGLGAAGQQERKPAERQGWGQRCGQQPGRSAAECCFISEGPQGAPRGYAAPYAYVWGSPRKSQRGCCVLNPRKWSLVGGQSPCFQHPSEDRGKTHERWKNPSIWPPCWGDNPCGPKEAREKEREEVRT